MGLFSRKTRKNAVEFCREFYDKIVFGSVGGVDLEASYAEVVRAGISQLEPSFRASSLGDMTDELRAVHMEMMGTAWTHASNRVVSAEVSKFTKQYLTDLARPDLWEVMGTYNQMVAESATKGESERTKAEVFRQRLDLFKELTKGESDPESSRMLSASRPRIPRHRQRLMTQRAVQDRCF